MATTRATSRQLVQVTVDRLVGEGVLERRPNPAHRRSVLIALTPRGRSAVRRLRARERALAGRLPRELTTAELGHATAVLRRLGRALLVAVQEERGGLR